MQQLGKFICVAGRPQDLIDVSGVIIRQRDSLDSAYIRNWLKIFSEEKPDPEILERFERALRAEKRAAARPTWTGSRPRTRKK